MHKVTAAMEAGEKPNAGLIQGMGQLMGDMRRNDALVDGAGLLPTATRVRLRFAGGKRTLQKGPYKGANDSVTAVISGEVTATIADAGPVTSQVNGGNARALAVAAPMRAESLPDVPTMKEAGADVEAVLWSGIFVPAATPPEIVSKLEAEFIRIARLPDVVSRLKLLNIDSVGNRSEEFSRIIAADLERWKAVARAGNIKMAQ